MELQIKIFIAKVSTLTSFQNLGVIFIMYLFVVFLLVVILKLCISSVASVFLPVKTVELGSKILKAQLNQLN